MNEVDVGRFLRLLAHDLQNQLGAIDLNLQVIPSLADKNDPTMKVVTPFVTGASRASSEMINTLTDVQALARLMDTSDDASGAHAKPELSQLDLGQQVQDCGLILAAAAKSRELTLIAKAEAEVFTRGNFDDVRRSLKILSTELLRTSFPGSVITIEARMDGDCPVVELRSTQEGLFESDRQTLAIYLATRMLEQTAAKFEIPLGINGPSLLRLVFQKI